MEKMKITAPVNSYTAAELQIMIGVDEIYLGLPSKELKNLTFSGRGTRISNNPCQVNSIEELEKIIKLAHDHDVEVVLTLNTQFLVMDPCKEMFMKYLWEGVNAGVDALMVGDVGTCIWIKDAEVDIPVYAGIFLRTFNVEMAKFLKELGIRRIVLPFAISMDEIREIVKYKEVEYEVFVHIGCSNINGRCLLLHSKGESVNFGLPCKAFWDVTDPEGNVIESTLLDSAKDCAVCGLPLLRELEISALKILGRCMAPQIAAAFTKLYVDSRNALYEGATYQEIKDRIVKNIYWWEEKMCKEGRCKYIPTPTSSYEV